MVGELAADDVFGAGLHIDASDATAGVDKHPACQSRPESHASHLAENRRGGHPQHAHHSLYDEQCLSPPSAVSQRCPPAHLVITPTECCPGMMINNGGRGNCAQKPQNHPKSVIF